MRKAIAFLLAHAIAFSACDSAPVSRPVPCTAEGLIAEFRASRDVQHRRLTCNSAEHSYLFTYDLYELRGARLIFIADRLVRVEGERTCDLLHKEPVPDSAYLDVNACQLSAPEPVPYL